MGFFPAGTYDLFLTHGWYYTDEWQELVASLDDCIPGRWRNWSLPWHDTSIDRFSASGKAQLEQLLDGQIAMTSAILVVPETARTTDGKMWLDKQLALGARYEKPIFGVLPMDGTPFPPLLAERVREALPRDAAIILGAVDRMLVEHG